MDRINKIMVQKRYSNPKIAQFLKFIKPENAVKPRAL